MLEERCSEFSASVEWNGSRPARLPFRPAGWTAVLVMLSVAGCSGSVLGPRRPTDTGLERERVVVRSAEPLPGIAVREYLLDRLRYLGTGDPHNVDRVIRGQAALPWPALDSLGIAVGDTVVVTTRFNRADRVYGLSVRIPDWPGHDAQSYLLGNHAITAMEKAGQR